MTEKPTFRTPIIRFILLAAFVCFSWQSNAQCTTAGSGQWPSSQVDVDNSGAVQQYNTNLWTDEFSDVTGYNIGDEYVITLTLNSDGTPKYITLVDSGGAVVANGLSPLTFIATDVDLDIYRHDDDGSGGCTGVNQGHTGTIQNLSNACTTGPVIDSATVVDSCNPDGTGMFSIEVVVSDVGDAGTVINDGTTDSPVVVGTMTFGPFNSGDSVTLTIDALDDSCDSSLGDFTFSCPLPAPENDECLDAITVSCGGQYIGDTSSANPEVDDPGTCGTSAGTAGAVWYTYTGSNSNDGSAAVGSLGDEVTLDLSLSTFDTKIRLFTGVCGDLTCVDGDDDGGAGTTSLLTFNAIVGTEYYILVHGFSANAGVYTLDVSCTPPPMCSAPVIDSATVVDSCNPDGTGLFSVDVVVSDVGDAGTVISDGTNTYPVVAGTVTVGPYNSGDSVTLTIDATDDACDSS
ncbi:MAG: hypothetical protein N4A42_04455, partial [Winogradskyella sp.]|nr:hypothetical protein [Winogradskyella sp.]